MVLFVFLRGKVAWEDVASSAVYYYARRNACGRLRFVLHDIDLSCVVNNWNEIYVHSWEVSAFEA